MTTCRISLLLLAGALFSPGLNAAEGASPEKTGLPVGRNAPMFALKDQNDREVALNALLKKGPVALVFYRSADW